MYYIYESPHKDGNRNRCRCVLKAAEKSSEEWMTSSMCAIYGDKSRWAGVGKARLSGSCQGQIINHHLVDGPGQGCLMTLLGGTVTEKCGPQEQPLPWTVSKTLYLKVNALLPHRTGLVPKVLANW